MQLRIGDNKEYVLYHLDEEASKKLIQIFLDQAVYYYHQLSIEKQLGIDALCRGLLYEMENTLKNAGAPPEIYMIPRPTKEEESTVKFAQLMAANIIKPLNSTVVDIFEDNGQIIDIKYEIDTSAYKS